MRNAHNTAQPSLPDCRTAWRLDGAMFGVIVIALNGNAFSFHNNSNPAKQM